MVRKLGGMRKTRRSPADGMSLLHRGKAARPGQGPGQSRLTMTARGNGSIYLSGPWSHRSVSANGTRFHVAESGDGPLVLLLHGFPEFWWTWRTQLSSLSQAGYRAVAPDLRGYGGSDKPPRGYDLVTAASDAAGLVRSLGEANAVVVGHDWGGLIAWTMATYYPKVVRRLAVVSMPHPLRLRPAVLSAPFAPRQEHQLRAGLPAAAAARAAAAEGRRQPGRAPAVGLVRTWLAGSGDRARGTGPPCPCRRWRTQRLSTTAGTCGPDSGLTGSPTPG